MFEGAEINGELSKTWELLSVAGFDVCVQHCHTVSVEGGRGLTGMNKIDFERFIIIYIHSLLLDRESANSLGHPLFTS